jgi:hypothetical protein
MLRGYSISAAKSGRNNAQVIFLIGVSADLVEPSFPPSTYTEFRSISPGFVLTTLPKQLFRILNASRRGVHGLWERP